MQYNRSTTTQAADTLCQRLTQELQAGKRVLWLVSGGSNVEVTVQILATLPEELTQTLTLGLIDERFGPFGHNDSNWQALVQSGLNLKRATAMPILLMGHDRASTAEHYARTLQTMYDKSDLCVGLLGLGIDGHTAGILPQSPATVDTDALVIDYVSDPYERITLSFAGLRRLDVAYVFAFGEQKTAVISSLLQSEISLKDQPAQIIKHIHESYVYNDKYEGVTT